MSKSMYPTMERQMGAPSKSTGSVPADQRPDVVGGRYPSMGQGTVDNGGQPNLTPTVEALRAFYSGSMADERRAAQAKQAEVASRTPEHLRGGLELRAPEGFDEKSDAWISFREVAKDLGLDQRHADRLLALHKLESGRQRLAWDAQVQRWERESLANIPKADLEAARGLVATHGDDALREVLDLGMGSHPAVVRFLARVARR